jgi:hypothetical protein
MLPGENEYADMTTELHALTRMDGKEGGMTDPRPIMKKLSITGPLHDLTS